MIGESIAKLFQRKPKEEESLNTRNHPYRGDLPSLSNEYICVEPTEVDLSELPECVLHILSKDCVVKKKTGEYMSGVKKCEKQYLENSKSDVYFVYYDDIPQIPIKIEKFIRIRNLKYTFVVRDDIVQEVDIDLIKKKKVFA